MEIRLEGGVENGRDMGGAQGDGLVLSNSGLFGADGAPAAAEIGRAFEERVRAAEQRLVSRRVDNFRGHEAERELLSVLLGMALKNIDGYSCYSDFSKTGETVVVVYDSYERSEHKYIFAETESCRYIVAMPMEWTAYHREILQRVSAASGEYTRCPGGGYIGIADDGTVCVEGSSGDFGRGNHQYAKEAFQRAVGTPQVTPNAEVSTERQQTPLVPQAVSADASRQPSLWSRFLSWVTG